MEKCPKCGRLFPRLLAVSRIDNKTMICDDCGMKEAPADFIKYAEQIKQKEEKK